MLRMTVFKRTFGANLGLVTFIFTLFLTIVYYQSSAALKDSIGNNIHRIAEEMATQIDLAIQDKVEKWEFLSNHKDLIKAVEQANRRYQGRSPSQVRSEIESIDREWPSSEAYRHLYTPNINQTALLLSWYQALKPEENAEIFVTDRMGALIAATNKTSDYWQADEGWWQAAFNEGRGSVYVGNLEFDDSAQVYAINIALPVKSRAGTRRASGVLKIVLNIHGLMREFAGYRLGVTGHVHIVDSRGRDLFESGGVPNRFIYTLGRDIVEKMRPHPNGHFVYTGADKKAYIVGFTPISTQKEFGPATFDGNRWYVLLVQALDESYAPVYHLMKTLLAMGFLVLLAIFLTAYLVAKSITKPLKVLSSGMQVVRKGDLSHHVELGRDDEFQELAESFNEMTRRLHASHEELEGKVRELEYKTKQLQQSNEELESFAYSVSHDLRAPLRSIEGFSQALLEDYGNKLDTQCKDYLDRVRTASQRLAQMIDELLSLSRVTRAEINCNRVDISALAQTITAELETMQPERQAEFVVAEGIVVDGDQLLLRAVFDNLLGNAWKFTSKNSKATIQFGTINQNGKSVYFVRDDGVGFNMDYADKLFGVFQRLHAMDEFEGTGIGLAIVERIIRRHGGNVWAEGAVGQGATFYFTLWD